MMINAIFTSYYNMKAVMQVCLYNTWYAIIIFNSSLKLHEQYDGMLAALPCQVIITDKRQQIFLN